MARLYVGSLPYSITDERLLPLFTEKGDKPVSARVITGYGFVELGPEDHAAMAIGELNGLNVEGRALQVNEARSQESRGGGRGFSGGRSGGDGRRRY